MDKPSSVDELASLNMKVIELESINKSLQEANESVLKLYKLGEEERTGLLEASQTYQSKNNVLEEEVSKLKNELAYAQKRIVSLQGNGVQVVDIDGVTIKKVEEDLVREKELNKLLEDNTEQLRDENLKLRTDIIDNSDEINKLKLELEKANHILNKKPKKSWLQKVFNWK